MLSLRFFSEPLVRFLLSTKDKFGRNLFWSVKCNTYLCPQTAKAVCFKHRLTFSCQTSDPQVLTLVVFYFGFANLLGFSQSVSGYDFLQREKFKFPHYENDNSIDKMIV